MALFRMCLVCFLFMALINSHPVESNLRETVNYPSELKDPLSFETPPPGPDGKTEMPWWKVRIAFYLIEQLLRGAVHTQVTK